MAGVSREAIDQQQEGWTCTTIGRDPPGWALAKKTVTNQAVGSTTGLKSRLGNTQGGYKLTRAPAPKRATRANRKKMLSRSARSAMPRGKRRSAAGEGKKFKVLK